MTNLSTKGKIVEFDATATRRGMMRNQAGNRTKRLSSQIPSESSTEISSPTATQLDESQLKSFLIDFVVEQTGYPEEIVELDADLEGDLGIDSIKKAQLFGELGERFEIKVQDHLSLDDFPTLRHVLDYLLRYGRERGTTPPQMEPNKSTSRQTQLDESQLKSFLIDFVVEQTGYPEEIVELDADLEGDLGIDSIKKAQLFGELGERFEIKVQDHLSLDDFPTLRYVLDYLLRYGKQRN